MITIESHPPEVLLAGNPVRYKVSTNNALITAGVKADFKLDVFGLDTTVGHRFGLSFGSTDLDFTLVTALSDDPLDVPVSLGSPAETVEEWAYKIYQAFLSNYDLSRNYEIEFTTLYTHAVIHFTARKEGAQFTLTFDAMTIAGISVYSYLAGTDPVYRENFGILMNLWNEDKTEVIGEDFKSVTDETEVYFNLSEYILSKMAMDESPRFLFPETGSRLNAIYRSSFIFAFFASFAEKQGSTIRKFVFDIANVLDPRFALAGGLSRETLVHYNNLAGDYFSDAENQKRFLTWAPLTKTVSETSVEKLYFFTKGHGGDPHVMKCRVTFTDDSIQVIDVVTYTDSDNPQVREFIVGYSFLNLGNVDPHKTVQYYQVWIQEDDGGSTPMTEVRTFVLDTKYRENERQLLFRNSLSAYDTIRITGIRENSNSYERQSAANFLDATESFYNAPARTYQIDEQVTYKAITGWLTFAEKDWLRDLLISKEVYEIIGQQLIPVVISSKKAFISRDKESLYSLEFEYERAMTNEYYSPRVM